jgi:hypothetical protein
MKKIILIIILVASITYFLVFDNKNKKITQVFADTGYFVSVSVPTNIFEYKSGARIKEDGSYKVGWIRLNNLENNSFEVLNSKSEDEEILLGQAPKMSKFLKKHSKIHLQKFKDYMEMTNLEFEWDDLYIGDKPYYMNTVWEIVEKDS